MVMERWRQFRTTFGRVHRGFLQSRSGRKNGGFRDPASAQPLLRREMLCSYPPPPFSRQNFLSGNDNGGNMLIQAGSGLRSQGKKTGNLERFPNDLSGSVGKGSQIPDQG